MFAAFSFSAFPFIVLCRRFLDSKALLTVEVNKLGIYESPDMQKERMRNAASGGLASGARNSGNDQIFDVRGETFVRRISERRASK